MSPTSTLTPFYFNSKPVRSLMDESGNPWLIAADVCEILDIKNVTAAVQQLDEDERASQNLGLPGGPTNIISESGLYTLIIRSNKPEAKIFRKWVTSEVLPAIRKTGSYAIGGPSCTATGQLSTPFSERPKLATLFFKNVDRLHSDLLTISEMITDLPIAPMSLVLTCSDAISEVGVCRNIARLILNEEKK